MPPPMTAASSRGCWTAPTPPPASRRCLLTSALVGALVGGPCRDGSIACCARWADTAYRSAAHPAILAQRGMAARLQRPKPRGKPMPTHVRRGNATRGKVRAAVGPIFAARKQRLRLVVRTVGMVRAMTKLGLANLAYNLLRFTWLAGRSAPASSPPKAAHQWSSRPRRQSGPKPPGSSPSPQLHSPRPITQPAQSAAIRGVRKTPRCLKSAAPLASGASAAKSSGGLR